LNKLLRITKYQKIWATEFESIKQYLDGILVHLPLDIIHIGSTSVPDLYAKPILDIDIIFEEHFEEIKQILINHGWIYEGNKGIKDRYAFRRKDTLFYEHHLYVVLHNSEQHNNHIDLKRNLQNNQTNRQKYSDLKIKLIEQNKANRELYTNSKTEVINQILLEERRMKTIIVAGGCFWGVEAYFKQIPGVVSTEVGYINGDGETDYKQVCEGSGHAEAVLINYEDDNVSLKKLLDHFFNIIDPTQINKQGPDVGVQYRTGIYNYVKEQLPFIKNYISFRQKEYNKPIVIELETNLIFYKAEEYHQDYLDKNKNGYCHVDLTSHKNVK